MEKRVSIPLQITKRDDDRRLVFGFAKFSEDPSNRGYLMVDRQGDIITPDELENSAYDYVLKSRDAGEMHAIEKGKATLVESVMITPEKLEAWGLPGDSVPIGWWTGYHVGEVAKGAADPWEKIKSGEYTSFSVEGTAVRESVTKADDEFDDIAKSADEIEAEQLHFEIESNLDDLDISEPEPAEPEGDKTVIKRFKEWLSINYPDQHEIAKHKASGHPESAHGNRLYDKDADPMGDLMKTLKTRFKRVDERGLNTLRQKFSDATDEASAKNHDLIVTELARRNVIDSKAMNFKTKRFNDRRSEILAAITEEPSA